MGKLFHIPFKPIHFYKNIPYLWLGVKSFYLRGKNGWSPYDTWNMDNYLLKILPGMLRHLAENDHAHPVLTFPITEESLEKDEEKWKNLLIHTAECFEEADEENYSFDGDVEKWEALEKYRDEKKNEGFDLLKENFWNLWD